MRRPHLTALVRPALAVSVLVGALVGCTSTPASAPASSPGTSSPSTSVEAAPTSGSVSASTTGSVGGSVATPTSGATDGSTAPKPGSSTQPGSPTSASSSTGASGSVTAPTTGSTPVPASSPRPTAATTEVPAPGGGDVNETVPSVPQTTAPSRPLTSPADFGGRVTARIVSIKAIDGVAHGPGEIAGPALAVTLQVDNGSARPIDLAGVGVTLTDSAGDPASSLAGDPSSPLTGTVAAGGNAAGTYVFTVGADRRRPITLALSYSTEAPTVVFSGNAP